VSAAPLPEEDDVGPAVEAGFVLRIEGWMCDDLGSEQLA
jgi:hypothetical protein